MPLPTGGGALSDDARLTSVCLSRTSGLSREQRGIGRLKLGQRKPTSHVTRTQLSGSKVKGQGHRGRGILWRPPAQLVLTTNLYVRHSFVAVWKREAGVNIEVDLLVNTESTELDSKLLSYLPELV